MERMTGLTLASAAWFVASRARQNPAQPRLIVCATDEIAADFYTDLETFLMTHEVTRGATERLFRFPTWERSPYSSILPTLRTRLMRLATLNALHTPHALAPIVVTSFAALAQATLSAKNFLAHQIRLDVGQSIGSRDELVARLTASGYLRTDPVEDLGTFAVRGEIIDLFAPGSRHPFRIELFDDTIEKIRPYDPQTQRTLSAGEKLSNAAGGALGGATKNGGAGITQSLLISPAREALINSVTHPLLRESIKSYADGAGISRQVRDPVMESFDVGIYPDHSDAWVPFTQPDSLNTLLDHLFPGTEILWWDEMSVSQETDQFRKEQTEAAITAKDGGLVLPPVLRLFPGLEPAFEARLRAETAFFLDRLDIVDAQKLVTTSEALAAFAQDTGAPSSTLKMGVLPNTGILSQELDQKFALWAEQGFDIHLYASTDSQMERMRFLLNSRNLTAPHVYFHIGALSDGFRWPGERLVVLTEEDVLGTKRTRKARSGTESSNARKWAGLQTLSDLAIGDAVVHREHGVGRYLGLVRLDLSGAPSDFLQIEYANKDKLYVPVYRLNVVQKHSTGDGAILDRLGSAQFEKTKEKVKEAVKRLAFDLVQLYAQRSLQAGTVFSPHMAEFQEFESKFPFDETPDQTKAIGDMVSDLESGRVMDRLVCGDVGFGKTEVAIRAAFQAAINGKQVAVLVPTTLLAFQHEQSFKQRMKNEPFVVESISRFKPRKQQLEVLKRLSEGKVDILIGTHRILSQDVKFANLGLVIVDEEHRFGVEHKERLKTLKLNTHVLTLTATPIPRTLHMTLAGMRDISVMTTPPVDRLPIRTFVAKTDDALIKRAIEFELSRGGQVFFVHNRVQSIFEMAARIQEIMPEAKVGVGHGQMSEGELEKAMLAFYNKETNVMVCTAIIESGLDVPSANTIFINRSDHFGLAQLYQLRGRVGRSSQRAYCYLLVDSTTGLTEDAKKRLEVIQRFVELGSGFNIASHDLEIRGGGNLLGPQQSGHINAVGFDLYTELLDEAVRELQGKAAEVEDSMREPEIKAPFAAFLDERYIPDVHQRLTLYRRLSSSKNEIELTQLEEELNDRFGPPPLEAQNLLWVIRLKQLLKTIGVETLTVGPEKTSLLPGPNTRFNPAKVVAKVAGFPRQFALLPDSKFVITMRAESMKDLCLSLESLFKQLM